MNYAIEIFCKDGEDNPGDLRVSSNIAEIGWATDPGNEWPLMVRFFSSGGLSDRYVYKLGELVLSSGARLEKETCVIAMKQLFDTGLLYTRELMRTGEEPERMSVGSVFHNLVRGRCPYKRLASND